VTRRPYLRNAMLLSALATMLGPAASTPALAQGDIITVAVVDEQQRVIPFAFVQLDGGTTRTADDSGRVTFRYQPRDSIRVQIRRMGFLPFTGHLRNTGEGRYAATLLVAPKTLATVNVNERRNTALARTGFYDRMERVQRGAYAARLITPEELDLRNPAKVTQMLHGEPAIKITTVGNRPVVLGRGGNCGMNIILDGHQMTGGMEELKNIDQNPQLRRDLQRVWGNAQAEQEVLEQHAKMLTSVDELINAGSVAAIEIYYSQASVPVEFQRMSGKNSCGAIVIWSGARK
jgi:hypothetical protein